MIFIALIISIVAVVFAIVTNTKNRKRISALEYDVLELQALCKVFADEIDRAERNIDTNRGGLSSLSLQVVGLAKAVGYELRDGFWLKAVAKKAATAAKPATAKKGGAK